MPSLSDFHSIVENTKKEEEYVHQVYNQISSHFSKTRYKPWPIVADFLKTRPDFSVGIDVGCGNGKYLQLNKKLFILGSDRSDGLISCAQELTKEKENTKVETLTEKELSEGFSSMCFGEKRSDIMVNDGLSLPYPDNRFDFAISIAVIHHFSSEERRIEAIKHIGSKLVKGGEALIYVWALEQETSRRGYDDSMEQDILVPWVLEGEFKEAKSENDSIKKPKEGKKAVKERSKPDLTNIPKEQRSEAIRIWKEEQAEKRRIEAEEELARVKERERKEQELKAKNTKYRYYHMYRSGELEQNILQTGVFEIVRAGYERDNWWCVCRKL